MLTSVAGAFELVAKHVKAGMSLDVAFCLARADFERGKARKSRGTQPTAFGSG